MGILAGWPTARRLAKARRSGTLRACNPPLEDLPDIARGHTARAQCTNARSQLTVVADDDDPIGNSWAGVSHRRHNLIVGALAAPVIEVGHAGPCGPDRMERRHHRRHAVGDVATRHVIHINENSLRPLKRSRLLVYHPLVLLLVDLDGVVYRGDTPVPGVGPLLRAREAAGDTIVYVTNNSFLRRVEYRARIESCGAPFHPDRIVTAASAVAQHLVDAGLEHVLVYGAAGLAAELRDAGLDACRTAEFDGPESLQAWRVDAVTVGLDRESDWHDLAIAADAVRAGAPLIVPNRDANYPDPHRLVPGTGAAVAALEAATGIRAIALGKPAPDLLIQAAARVGLPLAAAVMIGDTPATDIAAAHAAGCRSILLLTGVGGGIGAAQVEALPSHERPTLVARDARELAAALATLSEEHTG